MNTLRFGCVPFHPESDVSRTDAIGCVPYRDTQRVAVGR